MIGRVGIRNCGILARSRPIKLARVNDDTAERCAVTANELGCGVNNDISAVFNWADKVRRAESVVNNKWQTVLMSKLGKSVDIGNIAVGVAEGFDINCPGVVRYCRLDLG